MWCVADLNDDYIDKMEDVLETYERPYDAAQPVVCLDEKPITLHADVRPASPAKPGREARQDSEYERCGTANVFCAVEPKAGRHFTFPTTDRSGFQFAQVLFHLALQYPKADDPFGDGQPPSEILNRPLRERNGQRSLELLHCPLHAQARKLAQSGGNRDRDVRAAMLGETEDPRPKDPPAGSARLESADEPESGQDQLEV